MATINNPELIKSIIDKAKINTSIDRVPSVLAEKVVPVMEIASIKKIKVMEAAASDATTAGFFTTTAAKEIWIVGVLLSITKDAVADSTHSSILATPKESNIPVTLIKIRYEPTTAGEHYKSIMFPNPILIKAGTLISVTNSAATASIDTSGIIYFYETEPL